MISLQGEILLLDRTGEDDDILPLIFNSRDTRENGWFIDIKVTMQELLYLLIDAEVLDDPIAVRYLARNGQSFETQMHIEELISGTEEGDLCRLRGNGKPPSALLADNPIAVSDRPE